MTLLHIDSSILGEASVSRRLSAAIVARLTAARPALAITYRDLAADPIAHLSGAVLGAAHMPDPPLEGPLAADLAASAAALAEFEAAAIVVIGVGFYNFGIPSQLKAWVDRILIAGRTFRYGSDGRPIGMAGGKSVYLAIARGGYYGAGTPAAEYAETYLRTAFGFIGIDSIETVIAEGLAVGPDQRAAGIAAADASVAALAIPEDPDRMDLARETPLGRE